MPRAAGAAQQSQQRGYELVPGKFDRMRIAPRGPEIDLLDECKNTDDVEARRSTLPQRPLSLWRWFCMIWLRTLSSMVTCRMAMDGFWYAGEGRQTVARWYS